MDESISSAPLTGKRLGFSLLQLLALTTSVGAAIVLCRALFLPPLGSSGFAEAQLPALVLVIALWLCRSGLVARFGTYAVAASLLSLVFFLRWFAQEDWLMGHTHGPPQLFVATCLSSTIGALAGLGWLVSNLLARENSSQSIPTAVSRRPRLAAGLGNSAIVLLTLLSALLAVLSIPGLLGDLPRTGKKLDDYIEHRFRTGTHSIRELAEAVKNGSSPKRPEMAELMAKKYDIRPGDEAAIPTLQKLTRDDDPRVRRSAAGTLRHVNAHALNSGQQFSMDAATNAALVRGLKDEDELVRHQAALAILDQNRIDDQEIRLSAITILGSAQEGTR